MNKLKYKLGRNIILYVSLAEFLITAGHTFDYQLGFNFLLTGNILSHIAAPVFFVGIGLVFYGLIIKQEYKIYKFSFWDLLALALVVLTIQDYWYTIVTPHPLYHDTYGI